MKWKKLSASMMTALVVSVMLPHSVWGRTEQVTASQYTQHQSHSTKVLARNETEEEIRIRVYEQANPAVVTISHENAHSRTSGSGFIISSDGLVVTNSHVVEDSQGTVKVHLSDGQELQADVVGYEGSGKDLAAVKIRGAKNLPTVHLAPSDSVKVGQSVFAIGSPLGYRNTFTTGSVERIDQKRGWIQHSAPINHGNSGGPLLNSKAEVIGVNTILVGSVVLDAQGNTIGNNQGFIGIGLAIPVEQMRPFLIALQSGTASRVAKREEAQPKVQIARLPLDGQLVNGGLGKGDNVFPDNSYYKPFVFEGRKGQQISIDVTSRNLDPSLFLMDLKTQEIIAQNDDISSNDFNSALTVTLPKDGAYAVLVNAFGAGESGTFSLKAVVR